MITKPYLIFLGDSQSPTEAKTAFGVFDWAKNDCIGQWRISPGSVDIGLEELTPAVAYRAGARSMLIGVAVPGGQLRDSWIDCIVEALEAGLDIVSGMHNRMSDHPRIASIARRLGRKLHDVRHCDQLFPIATGRKRTGMRLLTVGTDCALGKKYTALALADALRRRGVSADFRATGQTGIMIAGSGVAIDAVVADFVAGAAEALTPSAEADHWDIIEGQGAIFHPAYAGVTLGLLHGSQPDAMVLCHDPTRKELAFFPGFPIRSLDETMAAYLSAARVTNSSAKFVAISLNTSALDEAQAQSVASELEREFALPCFDPMRFGVDDACRTILSK